VPCYFGTGERREALKYVSAAISCDRCRTTCRGYAKVVVEVALSLALKASHQAPLRLDSHLSRPRTLQNSHLPAPSQRPVMRTPLQHIRHPNRASLCSTPAFPMQILVFTYMDQGRKISMKYDLRRGVLSQRGSFACHRGGPNSHLELKLSETRQFQTNRAPILRLHVPRYFSIPRMHRTNYHIRRFR
jgi:hypothetical protein